MKINKFYDGVSNFWNVVLEMRINRVILIISYILLIYVILNDIKGWNQYKKNQKILVI